MIALPLGENVREVLVLGAHCDDVEIGCGGTLAALARARPDIRVHIAVFSSNSIREAETRKAIARLLPAPTVYELEIHQCRDGFLPSEWPVVKELFEDLKNRCEPQVVLTHYEQDRHQDHRVVSELTWNTFRNHLIFEYEVPKYDGDLGRPTLYLPLEPEIVRHKVDTLIECFPSQAGKAWFAHDLFQALMRLRGMECNAPSGFAEAFYARKWLSRW